jgi:hypothetical protein
MQRAAAAADKAAADLLAEVEAEKGATAAKKDSTTSITSSNKKKGKGKGGGKKKIGGGGGGGSGSRQEEKKEEGKKEEDGDADVMQAMGRLDIAGDEAVAAAGGGGGRSEAAAAAAAPPPPPAATVATAAAAAAPSLPHALDDKGDDDADAADAFADFLLEGAPDTLVCPLSLELFQHPVVAMDSHMYEKAALEAWVAKCKSKGQPLLSPKTNAPMPEGMVFVQAIETQVLEYIEMKTKEWKETGGGKRKG